MIELTSIIILIAVIAVIVLLFLACREVVCWYFKINEGFQVAQDYRRVLLDIRNTLTEINAKLRSLPESVQPEAEKAQEGEVEDEPPYRSSTHTSSAQPNLETMAYGPLMDLAKGIGVPFHGL